MLFAPFRVHPLKTCAFRIIRRQIAQGLALLLYWKHSARGGLSFGAQHGVMATYRLIGEDRSSILLALGYLARGGYGHKGLIRHV